MKIELTNQEIRRVFCLYMNSRVLVSGMQYHNYIGTLIGMQHNRFLIDHDGGGDAYEVIHDCKLILSPLSAITDEHAVEVAKIYGHHIDRWIPAELVHRIKNKELESDLGSMGLPAPVHQYLISKSYAVPLFFGIDHPANGKTAIDLGLALDRASQPARIP